MAPTKPIAVTKNQPNLFSFFRKSQTEEPAPEIKSCAVQESINNAAKASVLNEVTPAKWSITKVENPQPTNVQNEEEDDDDSFKPQKRVAKSLIGTKNFRDGELTINYPLLNLFLF